MFPFINLLIICNLSLDYKLTTHTLPGFTAVCGIAGFLVNGHHGQVQTTSVIFYSRLSPFFDFRVFLLDCGSGSRQGLKSAVVCPFGERYVRSLSPVDRCQGQKCPFFVLLLLSTIASSLALIISSQRVRAVTAPVTCPNWRLECPPARLLLTPIISGQHFPRVLSVLLLGAVLSHPHLVCLSARTWPQGREGKTSWMPCWQ